MHKQRNCEWPGLSRTHSTSLLCLPAAVRLQIYVHVGLCSNVTINLTRQRPRYSWSIFKLLLTCRTIYLEVSSTLYSTNRIFVRFRDFNSLQALRNLSPNVLSSLTGLTVHLNVTSCDQDEPCHDACPGAAGSGETYDKPLQATSRSDQNVLSEWRRVASHVLAHIKPSRLRMGLVCDVEDHIMAMQVVEPLRRAPVLADCAIRLGRRPDPFLRNLARVTAIRAMGVYCKQDESPFRFLDLPYALRIHILEYTDLVTPLSEVEWNPREGFYLRYSAWACSGLAAWGLGYDDCPSHMHYSCQFRNCWQHSDIGCLCQRYHAAYSSSCHCWSPPTSFFLVCRMLHEDAQAVFFKKNRFIITPAAGCFEPAEETPSRLEASIFLRDVIPFSALCFLRFIEMVFPPFEGDYLRADEPAYQDWLDTIDHVKGGLCLPVLTFRIYAADRLLFPSPGCPYRTKMTKEQGLAIIRMYFRAVKPLSQWNELHRFFAHLAWPFGWTPGGRRRVLETPEFVREEVERIERFAERFVLGAEYDSSALGKADQRDSQWLEIWNNNAYGRL